MDLKTKPNLVIFYFNYLDGESYYDRFIKKRNEIRRKRPKGYEQTWEYADKKARYYKARAVNQDSNGLYSQPSWKQHHEWQRKADERKAAKK